MKMRLSVRNLLCGCGHLGLHIKGHTFKQLTFQLSISAFHSFKCTSNWNDQLTDVLWAHHTRKCSEMPSSKVQWCQSSSLLKGREAGREKTTFFSPPPFSFKNYCCRGLSAIQIRRGLRMKMSVYGQVSPCPAAQEVLAPEHHPQ